jgi:hypothetical protein
MRLELQSIHALKGFAAETARHDPALVEMKSGTCAGEKAKMEAKDGVSPSSEAIPSNEGMASAPGQGTDGKENGCGEYAFGSFSCLVSRAKTPAQFRHVDAHSYERQYSMAIGGNGSRPTVSCVVVDPMEAPEDVIKVWTDVVRDSWAAAPKISCNGAAGSGLGDEADGGGEGTGGPGLDDELVLQQVAASILKAMKENERVVEWIAHYGKVLGRPSRTVDVADLEWEPGTVVSLHGGNVHYGPSNESFRSILFFTASPAGSAPYDVDLQFAGPTLAAAIAFQLWERGEARDRRHFWEFLERVLLMCVLEDPSPIDFETYVSPAIRPDHPIRLAMQRAQASKEQTEKAWTGNDASSAADPGVDTSSSGPLSSSDASEPPQSQPLAPSVGNANHNTATTAAATSRSGSPTTAIPGEEKGEAEANPAKKVRVA